VLLSSREDNSLSSFLERRGGGWSLIFWGDGEKVGFLRLFTLLPEGKESETSYPNFTVFRKRGFKVPSLFDPFVKEDAPFSFRECLLIPLPSLGKKDGKISLWP